MSAMTPRPTTIPAPAATRAGGTQDVRDAGYRAGDAADFDRLYVASFSRVKATLTGMLRDPAEAEDCAQEAFVRAFRAWPRWRPDAPAEAWVHRIAINVALSQRRRQRLTGLVHANMRASDAAAPEGVAERQDLLRALRALPPRQAAVIVLRHLHGYTNREIATALGVPERTVASRLAAARSRLASELAWQPENEAMGTTPAARVLTPDD